MGFGGVNVFALLSFKGASRNIELFPQNVPILIPVSGRNRDTLQRQLDKLSVRGKDHVMAALLQMVASHGNIQNHSYRGIAILKNANESSNDGSVPIVSIGGVSSSAPSSSSERKLFLAFGGVQNDKALLEVGRRELSHFKPYKDSIEASLEILLRIMPGSLLPLDGTPATPTRRMSPIVATICDQIAIVDLMTEIGVRPDACLGYSVGKIVCEYAANKLSREKALQLAATMAEEFQELEEKLEAEGVMETLDIMLDKFVHANLPLWMDHEESFATDQDRSGTNFISGGEGKDMYVTESVPDRGSIVLYYSHLPESVLPGYTGESSRDDADAHMYLPICGSTELSGEGGAEGFLQTIGELYKAGLDLNFTAIYGSIEYPMKVGGSPISSLVTWDHEASWHVPIIHVESQRQGGVVIDRADLVEDYKNHVIEGRTVFPAAGYLNVVWRTFSHLLGCRREELAVVFEDVSFEELIIVPEVGRFQVRVQIVLENGEFLVFVDEAVTCRGRIRKLDPSSEWSDKKEGMNFDSSLIITQHKIEDELSEQQFYQVTHVLGFRFSKPFRSVLGIHPETRVARVAWVGNWTTLIDGIFQAISLFEGKGQLLVRALPAKVSRLAIDPVEVRRHADESNVLFVQYKDSFRFLQGQGIDIKNMTYSYTAVKSKQDVCLEETRFCPYMQEDAEVTTTSDAVQFLLQVALSSAFTKDFEVVESTDEVHSSVGVQALQAVGLTPYLRKVSLTLALTQKSTVLWKEPNVFKSRVSLQVKDMADVFTEVGGGELAVDVWILSDDKRSSSMNSMVSACKHARFILLGTSSNPSQVPVIPADRIVLASRKVEDGSYFFLLGRRDVRKVNKTNVIKVNTENYSWVPLLQTSLGCLDGTKTVIYAEEKAYTGILGLVNCLQAEMELNSQTACFYRIEESSSEQDRWDFNNPSVSLGEQLRKGLVFNVMSKGRWGMFTNRCLNTGRPRSDETAGTGHGADVALMATVGVGMGQAGWVQQPPGWATRWRGESVELRYTTINFKDVMLTTGKLPVTDPFHVDVALTYEFSGTTRAGERVLVLAPRPQTLSQQEEKRFIEKSVCRIPDSWTLPQACTTPMPYLTAYHCLFNVARIKRGQSVLIHSGAGGFGMAAIRLALREGCIVYTTCSKEKWERLLEEIPALDAKNISNSRNPLEFQRHILSRTDGKGVDVAINTLSKDSLVATLEAVKKYGVFIELGKYDLEQGTKLSLTLLRNSITFIAVDLYDIMMTRGPQREALLTWFQSAVETGSIVPLPYTCFPVTDYGKALQTLSSGKNFGRCVIDLGEGRRGQEATPPQTETPSIRLRTYFDPDKVYILVGGFSGLALYTLIWMHTRGATKFVITTKRAAVTGNRKFVVDSLKRLGADIYVKRLDVSVAGEASQLVEFAQGLGKKGVGGVLNFAVLLRDGMFRSQTPQNFAEANGPKGIGTLHLDQLTRGRCRELDHFVVFSSVLSTKGGAGVSTYGYANSMMEQVIVRRRADGLPGLAICFGAIGSVGILGDVDDDAVVGGTIPQSVLSCIDTLDASLARPFATPPVINSFVIPVKRDVDVEMDKVNRLSLELAQIFGFHGLDQVDFKKSLSSYGLDSLIEAEVKAFLRRSKVDGLLTKKLGSATFEDIHKLLLSVSGGQNADLKQQQQPSSLSPLSGADETMFWFPTAFRPVRVPTEPIVRLESEMCSQNVLFFVHPIDGGMTLLQKLATQLHAQVYGLQCSDVHAMRSVRQLAETYCSLVQATPLPPGGAIDLCGYSYGSLVALEMALIMQEKGPKLKNLILLDGSPNFIHKTAKFIFDRLPTNKSAAFFLTYLNSQSINLTAKETEAVQAATYKEQVALAAQLIHRQSLCEELSQEELTSSLDLMYRLGTLAEDYEPTAKFQGKATLIKATQTSSAIGRGLSESYDLEEICSSLRLMMFDGHHHFASSDSECVQLATLINLIQEEEPGVS